MSDIDFTLTGSGKIELMTESKEHAWIVEDHPRREHPLPQKPQGSGGVPLDAAHEETDGRNQNRPPRRCRLPDQGVGKGGPLDDQEGRALWWKIRDKVKSF